MSQSIQFSPFQGRINDATPQCEDALQLCEFSEGLVSTRISQVPLPQSFEVSSLWPTYASAHNNLGTLLSNEQEAEQHFLAAIRYSADHVNAHYNLGQLYRKSNRSSESEHMLKRCISLEPRFTPAYIELAKLRGPNDRSVNQLLKQVVDLNPTDPYYGTTFGHWLLEKGKIYVSISGNYKEALHYYWKSLQISSAHQEAIIGAAKLLRKFGQKSRLFQLVTRWQLITRIKRGDLLLSPHVYLQGWQLKSELSSKAREYDSSPHFVSLKKRESHCVTPSSKTNNYSSQEEGLPSKWTRQRKNKTSSTTKQCKVQANKIQKPKPSTPLMVHHLLDSV
ncbi:hypothetical protein NQ314_014389 [Rhamnusium bicolor]|uniref:Photosystem I assembly protein Ycf3 n=1 Tax=Rhamnusium bicolor TaxID=1586634 RepID=A0AAV8X4G3_9CUCU|nr:hypothetical protein NQ314_014389 [Rhamnusium bicolor]